MEEKVILFLKDDAPIINSTREKLEEMGHVVILCQTASQARKYLDDLERVDIILLSSCILKKQDCLTFIAEIKESGSKWVKIPVFVITDVDKESGKLKKMGVDRFFVKDQHLDKIVDDIDHFLKK